jgi:hypothetical protein
LAFCIFMGTPAGAQPVVVQSVFVTTHDLAVPQGTIPAGLAVSVPIPSGAYGVLGWRLSLFGKNRSDKWDATAFLKVNGLEQDSFRAREYDPQQEDAVMLPEPIVLLPLPVGQLSLVLRLKAFNEDVHAVSVRANVRVWFAVNAPAFPPGQGNGGGVPTIPRPGL